MSYPHRIRLRGPWQLEALERPERQARMQMPARLGDCSLRDVRGRVRFRRRFGYPGRIDVTERVWLTFAGIEGQATGELNGHGLGALTSGSECEVTGLLRNRNMLVVDIDCMAPSCGLWDEVALEVRATAYLHQVHFRQAGELLEATGQFVGTAPRPLDLYLLVDGHCQAYRSLPMSEHSFTLEASCPAGKEGSVLPLRVELVDGGTVWYVVEGTIKLQSAGQADSS